MEDLPVVAAGRLGGAAGAKPEARLMGFLVDPPRVVGAGCLGREVGCVLAFDVEVFAGWVVAKGFKVDLLFVFYLRANIKHTDKNKNKLKKKYKLHNSK